MPAQVYEDLLTIPIALLEALPVDPHHRAYPLPPLQSAGLEEDRELPVITLENEFLLARVAITLGGRLLSLFDKRTGTDWLLPRSLPSQIGGTRGVQVPGGLELRLFDQDRANGMGLVRHMVIEPEEDDEPAGVWIEEIVVGTGVGFHLHWAIAPDAPELRVEIRIHQRNLNESIVSPRLWLPLGKPQPNGLLGLPGGGIAFIPEGPSEAPRIEESEGGIAVSLADTIRLWPRDAETFQLRILPIPLPGVQAANPQAAMALDEQAVRVTTSSPFEGRIDLVTADGQTLSAPLRSEGTIPIELPLGGIQPKQLAVVDSQGKPILLWPHESSQAREITQIAYPGLPADPRDALRTGPLRGIALTKLAHEAMAKGELDRAADHQEQSLNRNAEDLLGWWTLSLARCTQQDVDGERPELLNAHFLAPLEPVLRANSVLAQTESSEHPNPLLAPLADVPDELIEVACRLIELGLLREASRWVEESLKHVDLAMLRYLLAYCLLEGSEYQAEAAQEVANAGKLGQSPTPWRAIEWTAIEVLAKCFPRDPYLPGLLAKRP